MATSPDEKEFLEDDEQDEVARRSIFSAGWFRALLVLTVLAIVVVVSLPYLLNWLEPIPAPPAKTQAKSSGPPPVPGPAPAPPPATSSPAPTLVPAPAAPGPPAKPQAPAPPAPAAKTEAPKPAPPAPVPAAPSPAGRPLGTAPLPVVPAPAAPAAKPAPEARPAPAVKPAPAAQSEASKATPAPKRSGAAEGESSGGYWVQVGAFLEEKNAEALAKQLRGENFPVQVSRLTRGGAPARATGGQNQLFITGSTPDAVNAALKGKGTAQAVKGGVAVNPPFELETAMSLSSSLKKEGFKVVIRRAEAAASKTAGGGPAYHVVRVGGYSDRTKAQQVRGDLEAKGHPGFLTQGAAR
jgi:cell division septation protein DedD